MSFKRYMKDKVNHCIMVGLLLIMIILMGNAFKALTQYIISIVVLITIAFLFLLLKDFYERKSFYQEFLNSLKQLDQKYLITEMVEPPNFCEGQILCEALYEIDKNMKEKINETQDSFVEFKEYLEMWIHEIKVPLQGLMLMNYNGEENRAKQKKQIQKMNYCVEQILFYARADAPEKDYLLKKCDLETMVNKVILENKDLLIGNKIAIEKENLHAVVVTDSKWFEFILGQIINNSVKYIRDDSRFLKFYAYVSGENKNMKTVLVIEDHGIGICDNDINRVFEKSFTGTNGRKITASTGMGLYICKRLCDKLGHKIWIASKENEFTKVYIEFGTEDYYLGM